MLGPWGSQTRVTTGTLGRYGTEGYGVIFFLGRKSYIRGEAGMTNLGKCHLLTVLESWQEAYGILKSGNLRDLNKGTIYKRCRQSLGKATMVDTGLEFLYIRRVFCVSHSFLIIAPKAGFVISLLVEEESEAKRQSK